MGKVVAIDGPAGAGKSTVSKLLAKRLNFRYLDTGAMYRAVTYLMLRKGIKTNDIDSIEELVREVHIDFLPPGEDGLNHIFINGEDVTDKIRTAEIDKNVSTVAKFKIVRDVMVEIQRKIAKQGSIVMDGRDIGSRVLPDADLKFYVTASIDERARRRHQELMENGLEVRLADIKEKIAKRDMLDSEREISPLVKTADAILIDTTNLTIQETVNMMIKLVKDESNVKSTL